MLSSRFGAACAFSSLVVLSAPARAEMPTSFDGHVSVGAGIGGLGYSYDAIQNQRSASLSLAARTFVLTGEYWLTDGVAIGGVLGANVSSSDNPFGHVETTQLEIGPAVHFRIPEDNGRFWRLTLTPRFSRTTSEGRSTSSDGLSKTETSSTKESAGLGVGAAYFFTADRFFYGPTVGASVAYGWSDASGIATGPSASVAVPPKDQGLAFSIGAGFAVGAVF